MSASPKSLGSEQTIFLMDWHFQFQERCREIHNHQQIFASVIISQKLAWSVPVSRLSSLIGPRRKWEINYNHEIEDFQS